MNDNFNLFQVTEIELTYRNNINPKHRPKVNSPSLAYDIFQSAWDQNRIELLEQFKIMLLNRNNACLGISEIATGSTAACLADPKVVFSIALKANAAAIILAHNHPSGNLKPSQSDVDLTQKLFKAGQLLDIKVEDHLIVTRYGYYSMADEGVMPT